MSLQTELGLSKPFKNRAHEAVLNVVFTGTLLAKEGGRILREFGLTDAQFNVLMLLKSNSVDGKINQTSLGNMLLVNRSNITGLVDRMEKARLVRRTADPEDRRVNYVEITKEGKEILKRAHITYYERVEEIMSGLDYSVLSSLMESIRNQLHDR